MMNCRLLSGLILGAIFAVWTDNLPAHQRSPNIVIIFIDDMGYADIGPFGAAISTPHIDQLASEGMRFTDFYVAQAVCSASRAALLTGCYSNRVSILGALGPGATHGIHDNEMTLGELVKQNGYATACYGKWHLGHHRQFLPTHHGFDEYFGLPYSNDMWPLHPDYADLPNETERRKRGFPPLPLIEGDRVVDDEVTGQDQSMLTTWYTERAVDFIERNHQRAFLLYVPHSMVHVPLFVSEKFSGKSGRGLYSDVVMEIDWSVGQIMDALRRHRLEHDTLVIFTSDNGPWLSYGAHAGSAQPLREGKGTTFDGGCREPTIMWWPGTIPAGSRCSEPAMTIDIFPTIAALTRAPLPEHTIDGRDISDLLRNTPGAKSPHDALFFFQGRALQAVRSGKWKLHFPHEYRSLDGQPGGADGKPAPYTQKKLELALFNLELDVGETQNVAEQNPDVVVRLTKLADQIRRRLGDTAAGVEGSEVRPAGQLKEVESSSDYP